MDPDTAALLERIVYSPHAAGLLGSLLSVFAVRECCRGARVFAVLCGVAAWVYAAPVLARWLGLQTDAGPALIALLCAIFGAKAMRRAVETFDAVDWEAIAGKWLPMKKDRDK